MKKPGFTLIELLVASTIIIVIMGIGVVAFSSTTKTSRDARRKADMEAIRQALVLRKSEAGQYPVSADVNGLVSALLAAENWSGSTPVDPKTNAAYPDPITSTTTSFCLCVELESDSPKGNASNDDCDSWTANGGYYCVSNP